MKCSKLLALLLAAAMCLMLLAACASTPAADTPSDDAGASDAPVDSAPTETPDDSEPADDADAPEEGDDDLVEISFYELDMLSIPEEAVQGVEDAINAIIEPEIGVHLNLTFISLGDYGTTISMGIASGDPIDIINVFCVAPNTFSTLYGNGQLLDINEYVEQYGQELKDICGVYLDAYRLNGGLYGVPCFRNYAASTYLVARTDLLQEMGLYDWASTELDSFSELTDLYAKYKEAYPEMFPFGGSKTGIWQTSDSITWTGDAWSDYKNYDYLGDNLYWLAADATTGDGVVYSLWEDPDVVNLLKLNAEWYDKGYMWPDAASTDEHIDTIMKNGVSCSYIVPSELGVETAKKQSTGYDVLCLNMGNAAVDTASVVKFGLGVPVCSAEPAAAVKFLNLLYGSEALMNLLDWGVEGVDYQVLDSGEVDYVDGMKYHLQDFVSGNYFLVAPWAGDGADFRDRARATLEASPVSPYMGFTLDTSELSNYVAALTQVSLEYSYGELVRGYNETEYNEMIEKLYDAGLEEYKTAAQAQLDAFLGK